MYLMFEALGSVTDRELMLVSLDLLDIRDAKAFPPTRMNFILFNSASETRKPKITIPTANSKPVRLTSNGATIRSAVEVPAEGVLQLIAEI